MPRLIGTSMAGKAVEPKGCEAVAPKDYRKLEISTSHQTPAESVSRHPITGEINAL
jgi:hypothetical protein